MQGAGFDNRHDAGRILAMESTIGGQLLVTSRQGIPPPITESYAGCDFRRGSVSQSNQGPARLERREERRVRTSLRLSMPGAVGRHEPRQFGRLRRLPDEAEARTAKSENRRRHVSRMQGCTGLL